MITRKSKSIYTIIMGATLLALLLSACGDKTTPAPTQDPAVIQTQAAQTVVAELTLSAPPPTPLPPATEAPTQMPPPPGPTLDPNVPVAVVPTAAPDQPSAIANYNTYIYGGPGDNYVVYGAFLGSQTALVTGKSEDGAWWVISVPPAPNGQGWVSAGWVTTANTDGVPVVSAPPVPPTTELVPPGPDDPQATALVNVYVRTGPATNYPAYGIADAGSSGRVVGKSEDGQWWVVRLNPEQVGAGYGWVMTQYTQASNVDNVQVIENPDTYDSIPPSPPPSGVPAAVAVDYVNVRTGPGTNYPILGVGAPGASAEVSGKSADGTWWQIKIPTQYSSSGFGWVSADWVVTQGTDNVPVVEAPPPPPSVEPTPAPPVGMGCALVAQDPADGTTFTIDTPFNTTWVLQNTGSEAWDSAKTDIRYVGAVGNVQMHTGADIYDLSVSVQPSATYNFTVPMIAPFNMGTYGELWEVASGSQVICQFYVYITVP